MAICTCGKCHLCRLYKTDQRYADLLDRVATGPSPIRRAFNFVTALASHVADGMAKRDKAEIETILAIHCRSCPFFSGTRCTHKDCGCNVNSDEGFFNKLAWRSEKCPIGKW